MSLSYLLDTIRVWIEQLILSFGYIGIGLAMYIENLFPPIPSEVVLLFSGSLVAQGSLSFVGVLIASTLGSLLGALTIYFIGIWSDERIVRHFIRRYGRFLFLKEYELDTALNFFIRYGPIIVFFGRVIPIIRSLISLPAGIKRMKMQQFLLFTVLGTVAWNWVLSGLGMLLGNSWSVVLHFVDQYQDAVIWLGVLSVLLFIAWKLVRWRQETAEL
jgi:membrane protein DedA with SNARE-associated domain